jgi:hypothetical protein
MFEVLDEPEASEGPAIDRLQHVVRREIDVLASRLPYVTLLLRVHGNTETERWALERRRQFDRTVAGLVAEAAAQGDVRSDVDPLLVTRLLFGMINSLVDWYRPEHAGPGRKRGSSRTLRPDELADALLRVVFDGLR